jgi:hypothetical protein
MVDNWGMRVGYLAQICLNMYDVVSPSNLPGTAKCSASMIPPQQPCAE